MLYNFDEIIERRNTNSVKYGVGMMANPLLPEDHIPMWIADMDFACPPEVIQAMKNRLDKKILGYSIMLDGDYYMAVAKWMKTYFDWEINPQQLVFSPGIVPALKVLVKILTKQDEKVLIQPPVYGPFLKSIEVNGREAVYNPLVNTDGYYTVDFEDFEKKVKDPKTTLFILCSPHNPSGRVWKEEELRKMADLCFENGVRIISDEIHFDLLRMGQKHIPLAKLYPEEKRIITCTAPSKTFNLAGNALSNIFISDPEVLAVWNADHQELPNPLSIEATKEAYLKCDAWLKELREYLDENFKLIDETLKRELPQAKFRIPEGTYLAWIDLNGTGLSHEEILVITARDAGLFLEGGDMFVAEGEGFIRINAACPRSILEKALSRLCKAFKEYNL